MKVIRSQESIVNSEKAQLLWRQNNPERVKSRMRASHLKHKYGISMLEYDALVILQNNSCAICGESGGHKIITGRGGKETLKAKLFVDHNHSTGNIRGLLCHRCNTGLGHFRDNPSLLALAQRYLQEH